METELKDVLHLYKGCECSLMGEFVDDDADPTVAKIFTFNGVVTDCDGTTYAHCDDEEYHHEVELSEIFPILYPLEHLTREELLKQGFNSHLDYLTHEKGDPMKAPFEMILFLIKQRYDVFGLIKTRQAIDKTTLK